jgi:hypothetical protein
MAVAFRSADATSGSEVTLRITPTLMDDARRLAAALNALVKSPQFSNTKARGAARQEPAVNWPATKRLNEDFNSEVDGCESFVMNDGSICSWMPGQFRYAAIAKDRRP